MLAYSSWNYSPITEAGPFEFNIFKATEPQISPADSPPAMTLASPSIKSEIPQQSPDVHSLNARTLSDSGLGITTQEDIYGNAFRSATEQEDTPVYTASAYSVIQDDRKLASPFEEQMCGPASIWNYPQTTISDGGSSTFATPAPQFLSPHGMYPSMQYSLSPAAYTPTMPQSLSIEHEMYRCPSQHFTTSIHSTPAQMSQWTPQNNMSWHSYPPPIVTQSPAFTQYEDQWYNTVYSPNTVMTVPLRRKPHLRPSLSEGMVPRINSPVRLRAATTGNHLQPPQYDFQQQLPLPPLPQNVLMNASPSVVVSDTSRTSHRPSRSTSSTPNRRKRTSSPPASDFVSTDVPYLIPVRQEPAFQGDLYTPRYKRRTANGRWEGWCGYCQPGRWLDLKNSRYWEDKLRNHGICAKTKMKFEEPLEIRKVTLDGVAVSRRDSQAVLGDPFMEQKKREGLCGTCGIWVTMDGLRTKARDRAVGWWMHAYKCHDHEKSQDSKTNSACVENPQDPSS